MITYTDAYTLAQAMTNDLAVHLTPNRVAAYPAMRPLWHQAHTLLLQLGITEPPEIQAEIAALFAEETGGAALPAVLEPFAGWYAPPPPITPCATPRSREALEVARRARAPWGHAEYDVVPRLDDVLALAQAIADACEAEMVPRLIHAFSRIAMPYEIACYVLRAAGRLDDAALAARRDRLHAVQQAAAALPTACRVCGGTAIRCNGRSWARPIVFCETCDRAITYDLDADGYLIA